MYRIARPPRPLNATVAVVRVAFRQHPGTIALTGFRRRAPAATTDVNGIWFGRTPAPRLNWSAKTLVSLYKEQVSQPPPGGCSA